MIRDAGYGPKLVREYNELNILRFIKNEGPMSRAELAKRYKISKAAVSEIIAHLLNQGYVSEVGMGSSTSLGGRKPILLEFNPRAGYAIGIEIKRDHARVALADLNATICDNEVIEYRAGLALNLVLEKIFRIIDHFKEIRWVKKAKPIGIGVAIPGLIDYHCGKIKESDSLKSWQGFPIRKTIEKKYKIETIIENDVKSISLGEYRFGNGKNAENLVYLWIGDGLGAGIIINGELYRGVSASAGEIGYYDLGCFISDSNDFKLIYDGQKNFGDLLSEKVLIRGARRAVQNGYAKSPGTDIFDIEELLFQASQDNKLAVELLREYGYLVGILCIILINTLNPELILIGGGHLSRNKILLKFIKEKIKYDTLRTPSRAVKVKSAQLLNNAGVLGAIALVLEDLFYMERLNLTKYRTVFGSLNHQELIIR